MKHPNDILPHHEQKHDNSCVAWGLELVLKMHDAIQLQDYPLQTGANPCGYGFGQRERQILKDKGIDSRDDSFDFSNFERVASSEAQRGFPLIFSIPDRLEIRDHTAYIILHTWLAVWEAGCLAYRSRSFGHSQILSSLPMEAVFHAFRKQVAPDYRIHCLLHS